MSSVILYNVTVKIDLEVHDEWYSWMQEKHIPDVLNTGCFLECCMNKILGIDESDGISYAIQYRCKDMNQLYVYQDNFAAKLQEEHTQKYKDRFVAFRTIMEEKSRIEP